MRKIDLHGLTVPEALRKLKSWIFEARADGVRCGLIITGRGHHSDGGIGVLQQEAAGASGIAPQHASLGFRDSDTETRRAGSPLCASKEEKVTNEGWELRGSLRARRGFPSR